MNQDIAATTTGPDVGAALVVEVDGGALECVGLLLLLRHHVLAAPPGTLLRVSTQDPIAEIDLPVWCALTGHTWLGPHPPAEPEDLAAQPLGPGAPAGQARFVYGVRVEAHAQTTHPQRPWRMVPPRHGQDRAARPAPPELDRPAVGTE